MKNIRYDGYKGPRLPKQLQLERVRQVIAEQLTPAQREILLAYYFGEQSIPQIARERGINKSTVWRTLRRAENRLKQYLQY